MGAHGWVVVISYGSSTPSWEWLSKVDAENVVDMVVVIIEVVKKVSSYLISIHPLHVLLSINGL